MITNAGLKKFAGWVLVTSPMSLLLAGVCYAAGWRVVLGMAAGTVVLLCFVVAGILLLDSASHD